jgi:hypothetical protein
MIRWLWLVLIVASGPLGAQNFEISDLQETYKGTVGDVIRAPIQFRNNTSKTITLIIRKADSQIGTSQKNFFCMNEVCMDEGVEDFIIKVEPGQTVSSLQIALEAGLTPGISTVRYMAYNKANPNEILEFELNFVVEERSSVTNIYTSRLITLQEVYPNPATDHAYVNYRLLSDNADAKLVLHNVLGSPVGEYKLPSSENRIKLRTDDLKAGVYFYTLYVENKAVLTRKLVVWK